MPMKRLPPLSRSPTRKPRLSASRVRTSTCALIDPVAQRRLRRVVEVAVVRSRRRGSRIRGECRGRPARLAAAPADGRRPPSHRPEAGAFTRSVGRDPRVPAEVEEQAVELVAPPERDLGAAPARAGATGVTSSAAGMLEAGAEEPAGARQVALVPGVEVHLGAGRDVVPVVDRADWAATVRCCGTATTGRWRAPSAPRPAGAIPPAGATGWPAPRAVPP